MSAYWEIEPTDWSGDPDYSELEELADEFDMDADFLSKFLIASGLVDEDRPTEDFADSQVTVPESYTYNREIGVTEGEDWVFHRELMRPVLLLLKKGHVRRANAYLHALVKRERQDVIESGRLLDSYGYRRSLTGMFGDNRCAPDTGEDLFGESSGI